MTSSKSLLFLTNRLKSAGITNPDLEARWLIKYSSPALLEENVIRRLKHEPLAKIFESKGFYKYDFVTTRDTLDPRPDSETLLMTAFDCFKDKKAHLSVADICSGTGCLGLSFISEYENAILTMIDISEKAMAVAQINAKNLQLDKKCSYFICNIDDFSNGCFDLIFFNPPYLRTEELTALDEDTKYDPVIALDGGFDGLDFYRRFNAELLKNGGYLVAEIGKGQEDDVISIMKEKKLLYKGIRQDISGVSRALLFMC